MIGAYTIGTEDTDSFAACLASMLEVGSLDVPVAAVEGLPAIGADPVVPRPAGVWETWAAFLHELGLALWEFPAEHVRPLAGIVTSQTQVPLATSQALLPGWTRWHSTVWEADELLWDPARRSPADPGRPVACAVLVAVDPAELARELPRRSHSVAAALRPYLRRP